MEAEACPTLHPGAGSSGGDFPRVGSLASACIHIEELAPHSSFPSPIGKMAFPMVQQVKNPLANAGDTGDVGSVPGMERSPGVGNGNPL